MSRDAASLAIVTTSHPEARIVIFVECPLCDEAVPLDPAAEALSCPTCDVQLDLADDVPVLAAAA